MTDLTSAGAEIDERIFFVQNGRRNLGVERLCNELGELRARVEALEVDANEDSASTHFCFDSIFKRLEALEAGAVCPHVVTSDEGTSYCGLAEQQAAASAQEPAPVGSLVEAVAIACAKPCNETWDDQARAAIRAVAEWLRGVSWPNAASALEKEVE